MTRHSSFNSLGETLVAEEGSGHPLQASGAAVKGSRVRPSATGGRQLANEHEPYWTKIRSRSRGVLGERAPCGSPTGQRNRSARLHLAVLNPCVADRAQVPAVSPAAAAQDIERRQRHAQPSVALT